MHRNSTNKQRKKRRKQWHAHISNQLPLNPINVTRRYSKQTNMTEISIRHTYLDLVEDIVLESLRNSSTTSRCGKLTYWCAHMQSKKLCSLYSEWFAPTGPRCHQARAPANRDPARGDPFVGKCNRRDNARCGTFVTVGWLPTVGAHTRTSVWVATGCLGKTPYSKRRRYVQPITGVRRLYRSRLMRCDQEDASFGKTPR